MVRLLTLHTLLSAPISSGIANRKEGHGTYGVTSCSDAKINTTNRFVDIKYIGLEHELAQIRNSEKLKFIV